MRNLDPYRYERAHDVVIELTKPIGRDLLLKVVKEFEAFIASIPDPPESPPEKPDVGFRQIGHPTSRERFSPLV
jgi:hypothetical protein